LIATNQDVESIEIRELRQLPTEESTGGILDRLATADEYEPPSGCVPDIPQPADPPRGKRPLSDGVRELREEEIR